MKRAQTAFSIKVGSDAEQPIWLESTCDVTIGRADECGLVISDPSVSRRHCRLSIRGGVAMLVDLGSSWGTAVNGRRIKTSILENGDLIQIGDTELVFNCESGAEATVEPRRAVVEIPPIPIPRPPAQTRGPVQLNDLVGQVFVRYRVDGIVARSSTGMVYRAVDLRTQQTVALKLYWPVLFEDEAAKARFLRSMRAMVPLHHPHLVKLYAAGRTRGVCFTANEYIEGESTADLLQRIGIAGMLDWQTVWRMAVGLAEALEFIHEHNIVHRSVLPNNILIRKSDKTVKLGDSMLAKALDATNQDAITRRGEVVGEMHYLSPEQVSGSPVIDHRVDLYGMGATIYALLTGRPPFLGGPTEVVGKILSEPPEPPTRSHLAIPVGFEGIVLRLLAKRPEDRYANASHLLTELRRIGRYLGIVDGT